jgi:hypothetical protein
MQMVTTIGLDIAKSVFQVHGVDAAGQVVIRRRRALWPAVMSTAQTGRTHGCSDQCCKVKIPLANPEPSTHGPFRK